ncbi:glycosyltransferase [Tenacibaculum finnmarkense genomovar finnmarkense]|uniref:glycosyltransferase n=1 Tax=Tenacibaculum finnmarkense TaxID=2781243 RepID=UPI00207AD9EE|nr:glycosyltransferase [Tenacibaculum finnmarkense]MCM8862273.1 glycosyltransferase [Tenacibaculum finnmarkense genomovar finnmarkense]
MKILLFIDNLGSGGAQRQIVTIAKLLKEKGFNVSFLVYGDANFFEEEVKNNNIQIEYILTNNYLKRILSVRKFIRRNNFKVVISFLETPNFLNCIAAIGGKTWKVITNERSSKESTFLSLKGKIFAWFQRYSDSIVCNSNNAKSMWESYYPQYKNKLGVIYNSVTILNPEIAYVPKRDDKINILIVASYQYLKNPLGVVKGLSLLDENERKKINVNWFGRIDVSGANLDAYKEAEKLIIKNELSQVIKLNNSTKKIEEEIKINDIVGLFSSVEGLPNAICEAMMLGKPVIMTKVSDYEVLIDKSNGYLCDWNEIESINLVFKEVIRLDDKKIKLLGENSKIKADKLFSPNKIVKEWINEIYSH